MHATCQMDFSTVFHKVLLHGVSFYCNYKLFQETCKENFSNRSQVNYRLSLLALLSQLEILVQLGKSISRSTLESYKFTYREKALTLIQ
jgi:hypothetical protein